MENGDNRFARTQLLSKRKETYVADVECKVSEWTDNVNIKDEFWFRHTGLFAPLLFKKPGGPN